MASRQYRAAVAHPAKFHSGIKTFTVTDSAEQGAVYVSAPGFGCSRDYYDVTDDDAILRFAAEHRCTVEWDATEVFRKPKRK